MVDVGFAGINPTYEQKRSALMASSVQARCSLLAVGRTIVQQRASTSLLAARLKTGGQGAIALGVTSQYPTAPTGLRRARRCSIVTKAFLYTNWLALGFNIDSKSERTAGVKIQTASKSNFLLLAAQSERELTPNCSYSHSSLAKTIKTIN